MSDASAQPSIHRIIAEAEQAAWLQGFRDHQEGVLVCEHGYRKGDHHWESGTCLATRWRWRDPRKFRGSPGRES